jgi:flagellar protein FlbD
MIRVTRLNGKSFYVNAELIKYVEETPDTVVTLLDGTKLVLRDRAVAVTEAVIAYRRRLHPLAAETGAAAEPEG